MCSNRTRVMNGDKYVKATSMKIIHLQNDHYNQNLNSYVDLKAKEIFLQEYCEATSVII